MQHVTLSLAFRVRISCQLYVVVLAQRSTYVVAQMLAWTEIAIMVMALLKQKSRGCQPLLFCFNMLVVTRSLQPSCLGKPVNVRQHACAILQVGKRQWERVLDMVAKIRGLNMEVCTTLGMLTPEQAAQLRTAGLTAYNHNLDTSPEYYPKVTSSRKYQVRLFVCLFVPQLMLSCHVPLPWHSALQSWATHFCRVHC